MHKIGKYLSCFAYNRLRKDAFIFMLRWYVSGSIILSQYGKLQVYKQMESLNRTKFSDWYPLLLSRLWTLRVTPNHLLYNFDETYNLTEKALPSTFRVDRYLGFVFNKTKWIISFTYRAGKRKTFSLSCRLNAILNSAQWSVVKKHRQKFIWQIENCTFKCQSWFDKRLKCE